MTTQARELAKLVTNAGDVNLGDDISLASDGAILNFGADSDVTLTHVADTGLLLNSSRQIQFGDSGTHIRQSADGVLQLTSDTEVEINATTVDINANVDISGNLVLGGNITIGDADSDDISFGGELTSHIVPNADDTYDLGSSTKQWRNVYVDGTLEADAITVDGTSLSVITTENVQDIVGAMVTSNTESGITVAYDDADNTLDFTVGTLNQDTTGTAAIATTVTITDNESTNESNALIFTSGGDVDGGNLGLESDGTLTYNPSTGKITATGFIGALTGDVTGNVSGTAATVTTAAQSNITSLGTLTTLTVDNVIVNGTTIGHTDDTDLITLADGVATVAGEISVTTLDIGGTNVAATAAELNIMDGNTSATSTTLADADRLVTNDNGTMVQVALSDVKTYLTSAGFSSEDPTALAIALG